MFDPLISICMPAYNAAPYIKEAVSSILQQSYRNIELIIINDGSTDDTLKILNGFTDVRMKVINTENKGQCAAANLAFNNSSGNFIKFMDADDLISPLTLERQLIRLNGANDSIASAKWGRFYKNDLDTFTLNPETVWRDMTSIDWLVESLSTGPNMMQCALWLIPRSTLEKTGLWNEELSLINDFEFFIRVLLASKDVKFCPEAILYYRSGMESSLSRQKSKKALYSGYLSTKLGCAHILAFENSDRTRKICANLYQSWHHECYPKLPNESIEMKQLAISSGGSNEKFRSGGFTKALQSLIGWRLTKKIKHLVGF